VPAYLLIELSIMGGVCVNLSWKRLTALLLSSGHKKDERNPAHQSETERDEGDIKTAGGIRT
jgi:hypothetical protein